MGYPLLMYGLIDVANPSFEDQSGTYPTGWSLTYSNNRLDLGAGAGGMPVGATSLVEVGTFPAMVGPDFNGIGEVRLVQRFEVVDFMHLLRTFGGELGASAMVRFAKPIARRSVTIALHQFDGGSLTLGSGVWLNTDVFRRSFTTGCGPDWFMMVTAATPHPDVSFVELHLNYQIPSSAEYEAGAIVYWDRVNMGGLVDFSKGVRKFDGQGDSGYEVNQGDGVFELVKVRTASSEVDLSIANVHEGSALDGQIRAYLASLTVGVPRKCALWGDRDRFTNAERHYQHLVTDPRQPSYSYEPGVTRRMYDLKFIAPREYIV